MVILYQFLNVWAHVMSLEWVKLQTLQIWCVQIATSARHNRLLSKGCVHGHVTSLNSAYVSDTVQGKYVSTMED